MTPLLDPVPAVLLGVVETLGYRRAGEWELDLDARAAAETPLAELVEQFLDAFPYARVAKFDRYDGERRHEWSADDGTPLHEVLAADGIGFEARLDLALFWQADQTGEVRESAVPGAAGLLFERQVPGVTLTVWPNLFTNRLALPQRREGDYQVAHYDARLVEWPEAAARNRDRLEASLKAWERVSGGEIVTWSSDRIEPVDRYGFPATAHE